MYCLTLICLSPLLYYLVCLTLAQLVLARLVLGALVVVVLCLVRGSSVSQSSSLGSSIMFSMETVLEKTLSGACGKDGDRESDVVSKKLATSEGKKRRWRVRDPYDDYIGMDVEYESEEERDEVFYGRRLSGYDSMEWRRQRVREIKEDIRELATYKDKSDIARYIQNLESDLKDIGVIT